MRLQQLIEKLKEIQVIVGPEAPVAFTGISGEPEVRFEGGRCLFDIGDLDPDEELRDHIAGLQDGLRSAKERVKVYKDDLRHAEKENEKFRDLVVKLRTALKAIDGSKGSDIDRVCGEMELV